MIQRFLSAFEGRTWADSKIEWLDKKLDSAVEALATRQSDGKTLAIEHTIIEPFFKDKEDFAFFSKAFLGIEQDAALPVQDRWIRVFVPVGTLHGQHKPAARQAIIAAVHCWIRQNRLSLTEGDSEHVCTITSPDSSRSTILLTTRVVRLPGKGKLHVRRQQMEDTLGLVVEKALSKKIGKLVGTKADIRILLLERQHMNLHPEKILAEIAKRRPAFPNLRQVDEIWIVETMFYDTDSYLRFERYENGNMTSSFDLIGSEVMID